MNKDVTTDKQLKLEGFEFELASEAQVDPSNLIYFSTAKKEISQEKRAKALEAIERLSEELKEM